MITKIFSEICRTRIPSLFWYNLLRTNYLNYPMRKAELVNIISEKTGVPKVDVLVSMETFFNEIKDTLASGENVYVRGFGSFIIKKRAKKIGRHIKKNVSLEIPEHYIPAFKPAKIFVDQVKDSVTSLPKDESS